MSTLEGNTIRQVYIKSNPTKEKRWRLNEKSRRIIYLKF